MANLISVVRAHEIIADTAQLLDQEHINLRGAIGRVLATDMRAKLSLPPNDASAMDGYAILREEHHTKGSVFNLIGEAPAGDAFQGKVESGNCVRIFTGGAIPEGANHVIIQENVQADGDVITLSEPVSPAAHIRKKGIDFNQGDLILNKGAHLDAYSIALLSAANHNQVRVYKRPKIAMIANGDELSEPGYAKAGQVVSSNPYGLAPLIKQWGGEALFIDICKDEPKAIQACIEKCSDVDILLPIGGASVGDRDYMRGVFEALGFEKKFAKVAVKPGKPVWFGKLASQYVLGLPGNPASALVTAHVFLKPLLFALTGRADTAHNKITAHLNIDMPANTWRSEYVRASVNIDSNGKVWVTPSPRQDSSLITPFVNCNCLLVRRPNTPALTRGDLVEILMTKPF
ncbi:MAG: molybdopterin molybdotransferase MoeA [Robiginitomaculum sp.]|nr:molybdopterin molybdotransferase MoeA [Robiginitomaculum sp.]